MELNQYMKHTSEVTIHKLRHEIEEAVKRLDFLLDYATLPCKLPLPKVCMQMLYQWQHHTTQLLIFQPAFHSQSLSVHLGQSGSCGNTFSLNLLKTFSLHSGGYEVVQHCDPLARADSVIN